MSDDAAAWALLREAERHIGECEPAKALACLDRALDGAPGPAVRAVAAYLRAISDLREFPDYAALRAVKDALVEHGQWEAASGAHSQLGEDAVRRKDWAAARACYAAAIGCAEAGSARWIGCSLLRKLALAELQAGHPQAAIDHLSHALGRLETVKLLNARLVEAECVEAMGDCRAAMGDRAKAVECWTDAAARQDRLDRGTAAQKIRAKISAS